MSNQAKDHGSKAGATGAGATPGAETKAAKFKRLAGKRVPRALKVIEGIGKLAGSGYEYTPDQATKVVTALEGAVAAVKAAFERRGRKGGAAAPFSV